MKKFVLTLSLFIIAAVGMNGAYAQATGEITVTEEAEPLDGPKISVDKEFHDYGDVDQGGDGSCVFIVTNTGNAPLIISLCKGSCGCTVPVCTKEPIAPGASTEVTVKYDTKRVGGINKTVTIKLIVPNPNSEDPKIVANKIMVCTPTLKRKNAIKKFFKVGASFNSIHTFFNSLIPLPKISRVIFLRSPRSFK